MRIIEKNYQKIVDEILEDKETRSDFDTTE